MLFAKKKEMKEEIDLIAKHNWIKFSNMKGKNNKKKNQSYIKKKIRIDENYNFVFAIIGVFVIIFVFNSNLLIPKWFWQFSFHGNPFRETII